MIYVALATIGVLGCVCLALVGLVARLVRQQAREREQLLARLMHLAGRTWEPPPATDGKVEPDPDRFRYTPTPEQAPDF